MRCRLSDKSYLIVIIGGKHLDFGYFLILALLWAAIS